MKFTLRFVPISQISGNNLARSQRSPEYQQRLNASVKSFGILQAGIAQQEGDKITLVAGFGRKEAAEAAGLTEMPLQVYEGKLPTVDLLILACQENNVRDGMSFTDQVDALEKIVKGKRCTDSEAGRMIGLKQSVTSKILSAKARLAEDVLFVLSQNGYGYSFAYPLSKVSHEEQRDICERMIPEKWSRAQLEAELKPDATKTIRYGDVVKLSVSFPKTATYEVLLQSVADLLTALKARQRQDIPLDVVAKVMK